MKSLHLFKLTLNDKNYVIGYHSKITFCFHLSCSKIPVFDLYYLVLPLQRCQEISIPTTSGIMTIRYLGTTRKRKAIKVIQIRTKLREVIEDKL